MAHSRVPCHPGSTCTSWLDPRSEVLGPLSLIRNIRRYSRKVFVPRRTYDMYPSSISFLARNQATVASGIFRIIFNDFAFLETFRISDVEIIRSARDIWRTACGKNSNRCAARSRIACRNSMLLPFFRYARARQARPCKDQTSSSVAHLTFVSSKPQQPSRYFSSCNYTTPPHQTAAEYWKNPAPYCHHHPNGYTGCKGCSPAPPSGCWSGWRAPRPSPGPGPSASA